MDYSLKYKAYAAFGEWPAFRFITYIKKRQTMALTKWTLDPACSEISFKIRHLMITAITGNFNQFYLTAEMEDEDFNSIRNIEFAAYANSINTRHAQRDEHLKSADFFDAKMYPKLLFTGLNMAAKGDEGILEGNLTIKGITKPVALRVFFGGKVTDPFGQTKLGFAIRGGLSRKAFGITYGLSDAGLVLLGDEIEIHGEMQLVKQHVEESVVRA